MWNNVLLVLKKAKMIKKYDFLTTIYHAKTTRIAFTFKTMQHYDLHDISKVDKACVFW